MNNLSIEQRARIFKNAPKYYTYAAKDKSGQWYYFIEEPTMVEDIGVWLQYKPLPIARDVLPDVAIAIDWKDSLITRP